MERKKNRGSYNEVRCGGRGDSGGVRVGRDKRLANDLVAATDVLDGRRAVCHAADLFEGARHGLLTTGDEETRGYDGVVRAALDQLVLVHIVEYVLSRALFCIWLFFKLGKLVELGNRKKSTLLWSIFGCKANFRFFILGFWGFQGQ